MILSATDLARDQNCGNLTSSFCLRRIELTGGMHLPYVKVGKYLRIFDADISNYVHPIDP